ncbi:hypothetical protein A946_00735 [Methylacidiphilum kamchatkense Kam1]|uniref:Uncharacterized protein n=1 Tax=Methylacidiphilum kamchatkense Kam1 TaxID=1202785 RepID=A0ABR4ZYU0_9BACT|nr:hypothetical protein A946_00735 [Methylacidiphilum kamchatkense Kam1]
MAGTTFQTQTKQAWPVSDQALKPVSASKESMLLLRQIHHYTIPVILALSGIDSSQKTRWSQPKQFHPILSIG